VALAREHVIEEAGTRHTSQKKFKPSKHGRPKNFKQTLKTLSEIPRAIAHSLKLA